MVQQLTVPQAFALLQVEPDGRKSFDGQTLDTGLVERGIISVEQGKVLGLFPTTKHPERDGAPEARLRSGIADVLARQASPTPFSAAVVGLLDTMNTLRKQFGAVDKGLAKEITSGTWASSRSCCPTTRPTSTRRSS